MRSPRNDAHNVSVNTHVRNKIPSEVYHGIVYIANEGRPIRIPGNFYRLFLWLFKMFVYQVYVHMYGFLKYYVLYLFICAVCCMHVMSCMCCSMYSRI